MSVQRRLAAILSADVVGYSRLMGEDEAGTLARLKAHRAEFVDPETPVPRQPRPLSIGRGLALDGSAPRRTSVALLGMRPLEAASEAERLAGSVPTMSRTTANGHIGAMSNRDEIPLSWGG